MELCVCAGRRITLSRLQKLIRFGESFKKNIGQINVILMFTWLCKLISTDERCSVIEKLILRSEHIKTRLLFYAELWWFSGRIMFICHVRSFPHVHCGIHYSKLFWFHIEIPTVLVVYFSIFSHHFFTLKLQHLNL